MIYCVGHFLRLKADGAAFYLFYAALERHIVFIKHIRRIHADARLVSGNGHLYAAFG